MAAPSTFPSDLPQRTQAAGGGSWKDRNCPNMRSCWSISLSSYSLKTDDKAVLARRICMIAILGIRTAISIIAIIRDVWGARIVNLIVGSILAVLGFLFIAWCLAKIGDAKGHRKVLGIRVGRWHFDIFLIVTAIIHVGLLIGSFFGLGGAGIGSTWIIMWLIIFGVAWIATWEPEPENSYV